jgi:hypothetical protein
VSGRGLRRASAWLTAVPGVVLALALVVLPLALEGTVVLAALPFAAVGLGASLLAARAALEARPLAQVGAGLLAALALYPGVLQFGLPALQTGFPSPRIAELAAPWRACASGPLVSGGYREPSLVFLTETGTDLATPAAIAERLRRDPGALVLLEDRWRARIDAMWGDAAPALVERGSLGYFNVNRGSFETARLLTSDDPRWEPCAR